MTRSPRSPISEHDALTPALIDPAGLRTLSAAGWDRLVRQARRANLLARLDVLINDHGLAGVVPDAARPYLESARRISARHATAVHWEVRCLAAALRKAGVPLVLLKGAAYLVAGLPPSRGRLFSDVDILVPKARLADAEAALMLHGWATTHVNAYDQRYYREWMHELPPMQHVRRLSVVDVHHTLLPETGRLHVDAGKLLAAAQAVPGEHDIRILAPADLVLHSATHLFHESEFDHGLRDLVDLDLLLRHYGQQPAFWTELTTRAEALGLGSPLYYALHYLQRRLAASVPESALATIARHRPPELLGRLQDWTFDRALGPHHPLALRPGHRLACELLFVRSHWIKMPPAMLVRHLAYKAFVRHHEDEPAAGQVPERQ